LSAWINLCRLAEKSPYAVQVKGKLIPAHLPYPISAPTPSILY
jgi:hypothetical protein